MIVDERTISPYEDDQVDDPLQVGIRPRDDAAQKVARTRDGVYFKHLGDRREMGRDRIVAAALADLERDERHDAEAERGRGDLRAVAADHAAGRQFVQPSLSRAAGDMKAPRALHDADSGFGRQECQQPRVKIVNRGYGTIGWPYTRTIRGWTQ